MAKKQKKSKIKKVKKRRDLKSIIFGTPGKSGASYKTVGPYSTAMLALTINRLIDMGLGGQTNVKLTSKFIVLDVSRMPKEFVSLGMFTATAFVKDTISTSRISKKVALFVHVANVWVGY